MLETSKTEPLLLCIVRLVSFVSPCLKCKGMHKMSSESNIIKRSLNRLFKIFGVSSPQDIPEQVIDTNRELNSYRPMELRNLPGVIEDSNKKETTITELMKYFTTTAQSSARRIQEAGYFNVLTPEIPAAKAIMVGSIMSPTDLQTDSVNIIVENTGLGDDIEQKVSTLYRDFFNDKLELGTKLADWVGTALYENGSVALFVLPPINIKKLNNAVDVKRMESGIDPYAEMAKKTKKNKPTVSTEVTVNDIHESFGELLVSKEDLSTYNSITEKITESVVEDVTIALESSKISVPEKSAKEIITSSRNITKQIVELLTDVKKNFVTFSSNPTDIKNSESSLEKKAKDLQKKIEADKGFFIDKDQSMMFLSDEDDDENLGAPSIIEIPTQAVVPIIIPGSPDKHVGYVIIVDQWGFPLSDAVGDKMTDTGSRKLSESSMKAAFGDPNLFKFSSSITENQRYDITSEIFGLVVKQLISNKLDNMGFTGSSLATHDALSTCLFRSLLTQNKCKLVFVPESMMVYFRFKHRPDGTGKSLVEDMNIMIALKTTLMIASIMAATENAIDNKTIEVDVDEKNANIQQYLDMIRNAYVEKKMIRFDNNPLTVQRDLIQKSLTILPKGINGLSNSLSVSTEHKQTGSIGPEDGLLEKLSSLVITGLEVPHAALNMLGDNEFARSVATSNLNFSNNIKGKQKIVEKHSTKLIKQYLRYSKELQEKVKEILNNTAKIEDNKLSISTSNLKSKVVKSVSIENKENETDIPESKDKVKTNDASVLTNLKKIINNVKVTLPTPRIVVDKAQYKEIEEYIQTLDKIVENIFHDDMIMGESAQEYKDTIATIRALVRSDMLRDYIESIGFQSTYTLPYIDDIRLENSKDLFMYLANAKKGFNDYKMHIIDKAVSKDLEQETTNEDTSTQDENTDESGNDQPIDNELENMLTSLDDKSEDTKEKTKTQKKETIEDIDFGDIQPPPTF